MDRSSRTSSSVWGGAAAGSFSVNAPQADSRQRPSSNAAGGTLMDLVASSSRARLQQPTASLPPRVAASPSQSPFATGPWDRGSGAESISPALMPQAPSGSWRASVGGGDLMSVVAESARRSEQAQFYPAGTVSSPGYGLDASAWPHVAEAGGSTAAQPALLPAPSGTWRESLGGGDLMSVVAGGARRSEQPQFYAAGTVPASPGYGLEGSAWPPVAEASGSAAQAALPQAPSATWRDSFGGGDLMAVVAGSARRSEQPQFYAAGTASSPRYGLEGSAWPPFAEAGGSGAAQPAMPPATWRDSVGGGDLMSMVAESARRSQPPQFPPPGSASPMGGAWGSTPASFALAAAAPAEVAASSQPASYQLPQEGFLRAKMSQAEFDTLARLVNSGVTVRKALTSIGRTDVGESVARRGLRRAGVDVPRSIHGSKVPSLSVAQIDTALQAIADHISRRGTSYGALSAAHKALGDGKGNFSTFREYFDAASGSLSAHGRVMLEQARELESRRAREHGSGPSA